MTYERIGALLTAITAIIGILVGLTETPVIAVAIAGVVAGLWWSFGHMFAPRNKNAAETKSNV